ncbi:LysE/ArgO family amino acid transporter [Magnetospira sp. QH-2]|uniref:LysE/ArgO family amino acid transporter n=1 Tax=Magnetospira sp. (strain QH-2) TaxID=1288970 RepID=UPI0003E8198F|nr:LysE/ArgO family amino acid transporter [Magnetospira sp. QH-2]CCQ75399.1 putative Amino-acid transporter [Magnetospira sp. QH-2]
MIQAFIPGFLLGFSLILAIGAQNAFLLRQGLRGQHVFSLALTCALSDALLIVGGVAGFSQLMEMAPWLGPVMRYLGAAFLVVYGLRSLIAAWRGQAGLNPADSSDSPFWPAFVTCLALTWLNPHVYLDTVVLLGSVSSQYGPGAWVFGLGAATASFVFFFSLGYGARALRPFFARPASWRILDLVIAVIMWAIAVGLVIGE